MISKPPAARPPAQAAAPLRSIADVERETGLPRATIRIWERRYGVPAPQRDARGERCYTEEQVAQLQLMRRLVEQGHRPAKLAAAGPEGLLRLADEASQVRARRARAQNPLVQLLRRHDASEARQWLAARLDALGLADFCGVEVPAMNAAIGEAWAQGELQPFEEHLYSDCLEEILRPAIAATQRRIRSEAPCVLLTTLPQEAHGIGLLMAQAILANEGCQTISLGVQLPPGQIVSAARAYGADLVGLSFTSAMNPSHILRGLEELRGALPLRIRIWAGGSAPVLSRSPVPGVRVVTDVRDIPHFLAEDFALPPLREGSRT